MKKTLTIILLSISLSGFSQTMKGDWVIGIHPYILDQKFAENQNRFVLGSTAHFYLNHRLSIGALLRGYYSNNNPISTSQFYQSTTSIILQPELQYNFFKTRLTPFARVSLFEIGYLNTFYDNPSIPVDFRRLSSLNFINRLPFLELNLGLSYFLKERFALQATANVSRNSQNALNSDNVQFGINCIFIINNPRSEIESPR
jgi:hypothetical protein